MLQRLFNDVRIAVRVVTKAPGFCFTVVVIIALGIGANTAIFSIINTVVLHPLPYPHSERVVSITREGGGANSTPMFNYWAANNPGFADLAGYQSEITANMTGVDKPEVVDAMKVSENY